MAPTSECTVCSKTDVPLSNCARCKTTLYCSKDCQTKHWPAHKQDCKRPNYILKFHIYPKEITNPPVWRTLSVPSDCSFRKLHRALQIAFNWATTHSYEFHVHDPSFDPNAEEAQNSMAEIQRMIMGRALPNSNAPREYLLRVNDDQEWSSTNRQPVDCMHQSMWAHPRTPLKGASKTRLYEVLEKPEYKGKKMTYLYDYGDCWEHDIEVLGTAPVAGKIRCIDGEGHYVAEDAGCFKGWNKVLEAYRTASPDKEQKQNRLWFEKQASNRDPAGLSGDKAKRWDKDAINMKLSVLA